MKPTAYYYYQKVDGITWLHFPYASKEDEAELLHLGFSKLLLSGIELLDEVAKKNITASSNDYVPIEQVHDFERLLLDFLHQQCSGLLAEFSIGHWSSHLETDLRNALERFKEHSWRR